jgi:hypothetical protein
MGEGRWPQAYSQPKSQNQTMKTARQQVLKLVKNGCNSMRYMIHDTCVVLISVSIRRPAPAYTMNRC